MRVHGVGLHAPRAGRAGCRGAARPSRRRRRRRRRRAAGDPAAASTLSARIRVATELVPRIKDDAWFFDTELLVLAEKLGYRIADVPVRWIDDDDSRVKILSTAWEDVKGVLRLRRELWMGEHRRKKVATAAPVEPETVETR